MGVAKMLTTMSPAVSHGDAFKITTSSSRVEFLKPPSHTSDTRFLNTINFAHNFRFATLCCTPLGSQQEFASQPSSQPSSDISSYENLKHLLWFISSQQQQPQTCTDRSLPSRSAHPRTKSPMNLYQHSRLRAITQPHATIVIC